MCGIALNTIAIVTVDLSKEPLDRTFNGIGGGKFMVEIKGQPNASGIIPSSVEVHHHQREITGTAAVGFEDSIAAASRHSSKAQTLLTSGLS